jgi:hypothetical protein
MKNRKKARDVFEDFANLAPPLDAHHGTMLAIDSSDSS